MAPWSEMWRLIGEMWWLIGWRCGDSLGRGGGSLVGDMVAHWRYGGSLVGDVVTHWEDVVAHWSEMW